MKRTRNAQDQQALAAPSGATEGAERPVPATQTGVSRENETRSRWEKWIAIASLTFDFIIAVCAVVGGIYIARQLGLMREDNLMTRQSNEAASLESAATLAAMRDIADVMREAMLEARRQADFALDQNKLAAEASLDLARESLEDSRHAFEASQRARLIVDRFEFQPTEVPSPAAPGFVEGAKVYIKNTGTLPATDVRWKAFLAPREDSSRHAQDKLDQQDLPKDPGSLPRTVVGPGAEIEIRPYAEHRPSEDRIDQVGLLCNSICFFYGRVKYVDGFGQERTLDFCQYLATGESGFWRPCFYANNAD